jgi:acyl-CoA synthetase (AMP-forming)/AMP-acid ligase II
MRIAYTSGTTGIPKILLYSRREHENSVAKAMWLNGFTRRSRNLVVMPFSVSGSYTNATACIRSGATVVVEERMPAAQAIAAHAITHTTLAPLVLQRILDDLPAGFAKPAELKIFSFGAAVSSALRAKMLARLATDLCDLYGSNEAGFTSATRGTAEFGSVLPGVRLEIVDEHDRPLPSGEMGRIRVQTDCMVEGYLDDPEASARMFRNGWFYAGDLGMLHGGRHLQVLGRSDDLLNIGWNKFSPSVLEELVLRAAEIEDAAVCSVPNADGIEEICVAVPGARARDSGLVERIARAFHGIPIGRFHVIGMARIPRNANGKIQRDLLRRAAVQARSAG